jgi:2-dehydro-3-deoxygluconokinase
MTGLAEYIDILIANEEDPHDVFGISAEGSNIDGGTLSEAGYADLAKRLADMFGFKKVALTLRESASANDNNWSGLLYDSKSGNVNTSVKYSIHIVDRVGGGDAFGAGLIHSLMAGAPDREAVEFAAAASALKHTIEGDFNRVSAAEVRALMGGSKSGRVQR